MALEKVVFHVGSPKTGTSLIQSHLQQNRRVLRDKGVFYPSTVSPFAHLYWSFESHHLLTYSWAGWAPYTDYKPEKFFLRTEETCRQHNMHTLLLSAENAYWLPTQIVSGEWPDPERYWSDKRTYIKRIHQDLGRYDTKIVIFLRRQDSWIETWYNQWIKNGTHITEPVFPTFADRHDLLLDHEKQVGAWAEVFGSENIIVRPYESEQMEAGLLQTFLDATDLGSAGEYPVPKKPRYNSHLDLQTMEFMNLCNGLPLDPQDANWLRLYLRRVTGQFDRQSVFEKQGLLSPQHRKDLLDRYAASNASVARTYLDRPDGSLFYAAGPDLNEPWQDSRMLSVEHAVRLMMGVLYSRGGGGKESLGRRLEKSLNTMKKKLSQKAVHGLPSSYVDYLETKSWEKHLWGEKD